MPYLAKRTHVGKTSGVTKSKSCRASAPPSQSEQKQYSILPPALPPSPIRRPPNSVLPTQRQSMIRFFSNPGKSWLAALAACNEMALLQQGRA
eukprot:179685-Pyramimonas_sp.AAC.1